MNGKCYTSNDFWTRHFNKPLQYVKLIKLMDFSFSSFGVGMDTELTHFGSKC